MLKFVDDPFIFISELVIIYHMSQNEFAFSFWKENAQKFP